VTDETRARFLTAIAAQLPVERVAEIHLFAAIRQGGMESGVAVIAVELPAAVEHSASSDDAAAAAPDAADAVDVEPDAAPAPRRYTVYSARYRHTLKGPDRGKWETSVTEEADAPLLTVDAVVRGVQRRSGDVDEIVRLTGDELRAAVPATATN
jgi:hypothetical protein